MLVQGSLIDALPNACIEIPGYPMYYATECGNIVSAAYNNMTRNGKTKFKVIKQHLNAAVGYYYIGVRVGGKTFSRSVHRLIALAMCTNDNNYKEVNHIDGNKSNNVPSNLEWCSRKMNVEHSERNGLTKHRGENHHSSKLVASDLPIIDELRRKGFTYKSIANLFGVSASTIFHAHKRKNWKRGRLF